MIKALSGEQSAHANWKQPNDYHVTQLFLGNRANLNSPIYKNYKDGIAHDVKVNAIVYVPNRILTAVCFPKAEIDNEFPHMTLMLGGKWGAVLSNSVLKATCNDPARFKDYY